MQGKRKYGRVRAQVSGLTKDDQILIVARTRSFVLLNQGTADCEVDINGNSFTLFGGTPNGDSITFGGYDDCLRSEDINITFGAGTKQLKVIQDILLKEPNYISEKDE